MIAAVSSAPSPTGHLSGLWSAVRGSAQHLYPAFAGPPGSRAPREIDRSGGALALPQSQLCAPDLLSTSGPGSPQARQRNQPVWRNPPDAGPCAGRPSWRAAEHTVGLAGQRRHPTPPGPAMGPVRRAFDSRGHAAFWTDCSSVCGRKPGYQRRNVSSHSSLSTRVRICNSRCAPRWLHCICCSFTIRLLTT